MTGFFGNTNARVWMLLLLFTCGLKVGWAKPCKASRRSSVNPHPAAASKFKQDTKLACLQNKQPKLAPGRQGLKGGGFWGPWGSLGPLGSFGFLGSLESLESETSRDSWWPREFWGLKGFWQELHAGYHSAWALSSIMGSCKKNKMPKPRHTHIANGPQHHNIIFQLQTRM